MDNNDRRQRQANPTGYTGQQPLIPQGTPAPYPAVSGSDRFRQQPPLTAQSPTQAPPTARTGQGYGYAYGGEGAAQFVGSSIPAGALQYQPEYGQEQQPQQQQRTPQQYSQYASSMMYNVPAQQQAAPQAPYDSVQQYQPRQSAAIEVLSTQFGVPQQYYGVPGESGPTSAPAAGMAAQNVPAQYPSLSYTTQSPVGRDPLAPAYAAGMSDPTTAGSHGAYPQGNYAAQTQGASDWDNTYAEYQTQVKRTFECIRDGRLSEGGGCLLRITKWLLGNAEALGLVRDDEPMHGERLKLWEEFNTAWLSILQKQKEMVQEMAEAGQAPRPPQSLMEYDFMESMGKELVGLCDSMEKHGLVDYQMGVWEEEIVAILTKTLDTMEEQTGAGGQGPAAAVRRR
ncbi:37s ribosomal protein s9 [Lasiodiplodia theobromae]|uniref:Uncharacterized protein n=1 Tax=Lasiodiplodia theobromae TaxID=45133 RepID=A0A5N5D187_9PEZI|nr:37s ribosomal protein s9 [Lasiodiplodia theobromae]KAB2571428.1 hypothetical protein DBV05_g9911 [Lasiodiplodia theobromae]KAF4545394.1 37s ribosomal protein s9 [Lasiodiplodia theobromae]